MHAATRRLRLGLLALFVGFLALARVWAVDVLPLAQVKPGAEGVVWTVFQGTKPEPFKVRVTGVLENALGPGRSLIVCELTDPRVQQMGAAAGMSGSPLYIGGKLAGALSYQIQHFETTHYAGFTPAEDLSAVRDSALAAPEAAGAATVESPAGSFVPLRPVFSFGGLSPQVEALLAKPFADLGITLGAPVGGTDASASPGSKPADIQPGSPIAAALCVGDITLGATGTVSMVDGSRVVAFGHPMMGLGDTDLPFCSADILTILPSTMSSYKLANVGGVIGTLQEDRLSGVSGLIGPAPRMIDVTVHVHPLRGDVRTLHIQVARIETLTPMIVASAVLQGLLGSNDAGQSEGFKLTASVDYPGRAPLATTSLYPGAQSFVLGLRDFALKFSSLLYNPYEHVYPDKVDLEVTSLKSNPIAVVEQFQLSRTVARPGETVVASVSWRDFQGTVHHDQIPFTADPAWTGKTLDVVLMSGSVLDELTGKSRMMTAAQFRSFDAFAAALLGDRRPDGAYLAVVEKTSLFADQWTTTPELPGSLERIARGADEARFQHVDAYQPLFEQHLIDGRLTAVALRRTLKVED